MFRNSSFHNSRASEIKISEIPNFINPCFQKYRFSSKFPEIQKCRCSEMENFGNPVVQKSRFWEIHLSRYSDMEKCRCAEMHTCGNSIIQKASFWEIHILRNTGLRNLPLLRFMFSPKSIWTKSINQNVTFLSKSLLIKHDMSIDSACVEI